MRINTDELLDNLLIGFPVGVTIFVLLWNSMLFFELHKISVGQTFFFIVINGLWFWPLYINKQFRKYDKKHSKVVR